MPESISKRLYHAWNAFRNRDPANANRDAGPGDSRRPDRVRMTIGNEKTIVTSIYTRIAIDVAAVSIRHVKLDENNRYLEDIVGPLNNCLSYEANIDQTGRALIQDLVLTMFDKGVVAVVPVDTTLDPKSSDSYLINTLRVGEIIAWHPAHVKVLLYNDQTGKKEELLLPKKMVAIIENPLYAVMNEPNSTLRRLIYKLGLSDVVDDQISSGKLDIIVQLPYTLKSDAKKEQAEQRRKDIEFQLTGSRYGVAYLEATEKITQLNRPVENNLMKQIEFLTSMLYGQLGITTSVLDGTADDKTMLNYFNRTPGAILDAIVFEFSRKFLTKTARTQRQVITYFQDPFKLVPVKDLAEIADKFTRNAILSSNEIRGMIGFKPSSDPEADKLQNKNIAPSGAEAIAPKKEKEDKVDEV